MAVANAAQLPKIEKTSQEIDNLSFDTENNVRVFEPVASDGQNLQRMRADAVAIKMTVVGSVTYLAYAAPGTTQATAKWQCRKIDESSDFVMTFADGDAAFDNVATDLTALIYS